MRITTGSRWRSSGRWSKAQTSQPATSSISPHFSTPQTAILPLSRPISLSAIPARRHDTFSLTFNISATIEDPSGRRRWERRGITLGQQIGADSRLLGPCPRLASTGNKQSRARANQSPLPTRPHRLPPLCQHRAIHRSRLQPLLSSRARLESDREELNSKTLGEFQSKCW